jgi:outer membrane beta-barrel protein
MRLGLLLLFAVAGRARAQDPVDIGVIQESDVVVVQKLLYPKAGRTEFGLYAGVMPWDVYTLTPTVQVSVDLHRTEDFSFGGVVGVGYGFKSHAYRELETQHGVAPYAYRYLGSALVGVGWAPIYAKMNLDGARIVHFDVFGNARAGVTFEQSLIPEGGSPFSPTLSAAIGTRIFLGDFTTLRLEMRDDLHLQRRRLTDSFALNQNAMLLVGLTALTGGKQ